MKLDSTLKSPKTTAAAVLLVIYTIARAAYHVVDGDDSTVPDWDTVTRDRKSTRLNSSH